MIMKLQFGIFAVLACAVSSTHLLDQARGFDTPQKHAEAEQQEHHSFAVSLLRNESNADEILTTDVGENDLLIEANGKDTLITKSLGPNTSEGWDSDTRYDFEFHKARVHVGSNQQNVSVQLNPSEDGVKKIIMAIVLNEIATDKIQVRCQSLHNSKLIRDYNYRDVGPFKQFTWFVVQVNFMPNELRCLFVWKDKSLTYSLYRDSPHHTQPTNSYWTVAREGLHGFVKNLGYVLMKTWS